MTTVLNIDSTINPNIQNNNNTIKQAFLELLNIDPSLIINPQTIDQLLRQGFHQCGIEVISSSFNQDDYKVICGTIRLHQSQIGIHLWPETQSASISILDTSNHLNFEALTAAISTQLGATNSYVYQIQANPLITETNTGVATPSPNVAGNLQMSCNLSKMKQFPKDNTLDWVYEYDEAGEQHQYKVKEILAIGETQYQQYAILDTYAFGALLFLDGYVQSAQKDEHIYHECLIQPAMLAHPAPKKALVIGAGEGATAREILYHPSIERVVLIDLDEELINLCDKYLTTFHRGAFHHPKVELAFQDGYSYLENTNERFDIIVIDVVDAIEEGPAQKLYTREFYHFLKTKCLTENGIVVVQSMEMNDVDLNDDWHVHREMSQSFNHVCSYATFVPSFWSKWRYTIASDAIDLNVVTQEQLDAAIQQRGIENKLNFFSGEVFPSLRGLSKQARLSLTQVLNNPDNLQQHEADISKHFIDWDLDAYLESTKQKDLD